MNQPRAGEDMVSSSRNLRYICSNGIWYFKTREGNHIGPFASRQEMQDGLDAYISKQQKLKQPAA